jgi:hypothetical protein
MSVPLAYDRLTWAKPGFLLPGFVRKIDKVVSPKTVLFGDPGSGIGNNDMLLPRQLNTLNWSPPTCVDNNNDDNGFDTMPVIESGSNSDSMSSSISVPTSYLSANDINLNEPPKLLCASGCCTPAEASETSEASDSDDHDSLPKLTDSDSDVDDCNSRRNYINSNSKF